MKKQILLQRIDQSLDDVGYIARHRGCDQDFTRDRMLTFRTLAVLMLSKGTKSLQLLMNTFLPKLGLNQSTVDKSAYSRARGAKNET